MEKELCECGKIATWVYDPGYSSGDSPYFCDDHVHRGCSCNWEYSDPNAYYPPLSEEEIEKPTGTEGIDWKWVVKEVDGHFEEIRKGTCWTPLDENLREYPCCEYSYDEDGFDKKES